MNLLVLKSLGSAVLALALIYSGWTLHAWKTDAEQLAAERASEKAYRDAANRSESLVAQVEQALHRLEANRYVTVKETARETQRIEYRCVLPDSGRLLYERAAAGAAGVPGEPQGSVPASGSAAEAR